MYSTGHIDKKETDQPKPETGEWTAETVHQITKLCLSWHDRQNIAETHNAALDAATKPLLLQIEMDTECIERIRKRGMELEAAQQPLVDALKEIIIRCSDRWQFSDIREIAEKVVKS